MVGEPLPGTRVYEAAGDDAAYRRWWDALSRRFPRGLVSPGGARPYAGVSRAAVHKAMREGRLTAFCFKMTKPRTTLFWVGRERCSPFIYIPVVELRAWRLEIQKRAAEVVALNGDLKRAEEQLRRELEGAAPDWTADFLDGPARVGKGKRR